MRGLWIEWINSYGMDREAVMATCFELCPAAIDEDLLYYFSDGVVAIWGDQRIVAIVDFSEARA